MKKPESAEKRILDDKQDKLDALVELGVNPYPSRSSRTHTAADFAKAFDKLDGEAASVTVVGRIRAMRRLGKVTFGVLEDGTGEVQVFLQKESLANAYDQIRKLEVGDFLQVTGIAFNTKTKEKTVKAKNITVLAKALRPLPDKFHGLKDQESRFRRRELDLIMNKDVRDLFKKRALILRYFRDFLDAEGFLEVETPVLQPLPGGTEATPFVTHHETLDVDLYLRIAPELYLKRLIVGGFERVYELGKIFRNEGVSPQHLQEITELEFYQAYASYEDLITLSEKMISEVLKKTFGTLKFKYGDDEIDFKTPWPRLDFFDEVQKASGIELGKHENTKSLAKEIKKKKIDMQIDKQWGLGRLVDNLYKATVRPNILQPSHLVGHPIATSPLAKKDLEKPGRVERVQIVVAGSEITNAYSELNDPRDQRKRFEEQAKLRDAGDREAHVMDQDFVEALEYGMPPTAGFGLGIDRLLAITTNAQNIREVVFFPTLRPKS